MSTIGSAVLHIPYAATQGLSGLCKQFPYFRLRRKPILL